MSIQSSSLRSPHKIYSPQYPMGSDYLGKSSHGFLTSSENNRRRHSPTNNRNDSHKSSKFSSYSQNSENQASAPSFQSRFSKDSSCSSETFKSSLGTPIRNGIHYPTSTAVNRRLELSPLSPSSQVSGASTEGSLRPSGKMSKEKKRSMSSIQLALKRSEQAPVTLQGWLYKQGSDGFMLWKKRWFVLSEYCLFYYKSPEEEKVSGSILLPSYKISPVAKEDGVFRKFSFKAEHHNMRTYYFAAESKESMTQWMNALSLASILQQQQQKQKQHQQQVHQQQVHQQQMHQQKLHQQQMQQHQVHQQNQMQKVHQQNQMQKVHQQNQMQQHQQQVHQQQMQQMQQQQQIQQQRYSSQTSSLPSSFQNTVKVIQHHPPAIYQMYNSNGTAYVNTPEISIPSKAHQHLYANAPPKPARRHYSPSPENERRTPETYAVSVPRFNHRPHSADFLENESRLTARSRVKSLSQSREQPPRPKSSIEQSSSAYYAERDRATPFIDLSCIYTKEKEIPTPFPRRENESKTLSPYQNIPLTSRLRYETSKSLNVPQETLDSDSGSEFRRSIIGRHRRSFPEPILQEDFRKKEQREESMKRLLEWKQRMLQSPLTRKSSRNTSRTQTPTELSSYSPLNLTKESLEPFTSKSLSDRKYNYKNSNVATKSARKIESSSSSEQENEPRSSRKKQGRSRNSSKDSKRSSRLRDSPEYININSLEDTVAQQASELSVRETTANLNHWQRSLPLRPEDWYNETDFDFAKRPFLEELERDRKSFSKEDVSFVTLVKQPSLASVSGFDSVGETKSEFVLRNKTRSKDNKLSSPSLPSSHHHTDSNSNDFLVYKNETRNSSLASETKEEESTYLIMTQKSSPLFHSHNSLSHSHELNRSSQNPYLNHLKEEFVDKSWNYEYTTHLEDESPYVDMMSDEREDCSQEVHNKKKYEEQEKEKDRKNRESQSVSQSFETPSPFIYERNTRNNDHYEYLYRASTQEALYTEIPDDSRGPLEGLPDIIGNTSGPSTSSSFSIVENSLQRRRSEPHSLFRLNISDSFKPASFFLEASVSESQTGSKTRLLPSTPQFSQYKSVYDMDECLNSSSLSLSKFSESSYYEAPPPPPPPPSYPPPFEENDNFKNKETNEENEEEEKTEDVIWRENLRKASKRVARYDSQRTYMESRSPSISRGHSSSSSSYRHHHELYHERTNESLIFPPLPMTPLDVVQSNFSNNAQSHTQSHSLTSTTERSEERINEPNLSVSQSQFDSSLEIKTRGEKNDSELRAQDLLSKSHEELVLLLLTLRRNSVTYSEEIESIKLQLENRVGSSTLATRQRLRDLEERHAREAPFLSLLDNMVKLGTLYRGPQGAPLSHRLLRNAPMIKDDDQSKSSYDLESLDSKQRKADIQTKMEELYELEYTVSTQRVEVKYLLIEHQELLERSLEVARKSGTDYKASLSGEDTQQLENELTRVRSQLHQCQQKLDESSCEHARWEHDVLFLRQRLQSSASHDMIYGLNNSAETLLIENELAVVQQKASELHRKRSEMQTAVSHWTSKQRDLLRGKDIRDSSTGKLGSQSVSSHSRSLTSWFETDLDANKYREYSSHEKKNPGIYNNQNTTSSINNNTNATTTNNNNNKYNDDHNYYNHHHHTDDDEEEEEEDIQTVHSDGITSTFDDISEADDRVKKFYGILPKNELNKTVRMVKRDSKERKKTDSDDEEEEDEETERRYEDESLRHDVPPPPLPRGNYQNLHDFLTPNTRESSKQRSDSRNSFFSPYRFKREERPGSSLSAHERLFGSSRETSMSPPPTSKNSSVSSPNNSPIFKSAAAKAIVQEMAQHQPQFRRKRDKKRSYTITGSNSSIIEAALNTSHSTRSRDDLDMEQALRSGSSAPDVVKSTLDKRDMKINSATIDNLFGVPEKIVIPERYIAETDMDQISTEEREIRLKKADSIRRMLSETSGINTQNEITKEAATPLLEEKKHRDHLLTLNHVLARQVMEKSRIVAAKSNGSTR